MPANVAQPQPIGIDGQIAPSDAFHRDRFPDLGTDYILANPPFNDSDWRGELLREHKRWQYGAPPAMDWSVSP